MDFVSLDSAAGGGGFCGVAFFTGAFSFSFLPLFLAVCRLITRSELPTPAAHKCFT